jgi:hypothetical protein
MRPQFAPSQTREQMEASLRSRCGDIEKPRSFAEVQGTLDPANIFDERIALACRPGKQANPLPIRERYILY